MAGTYSNVTLKGPNQADVVRYLKESDWTAFISPNLDKYVVVYQGAYEYYQSAARDLTGHFNCAGLAAVCCEDAYLYYELYQGGLTVDTYVSNPQIMDENQFIEPAPRGGDARMLWQTFGAQTTIKRIEKLLRKPHQEADGYEAASVRHKHLVELLGLPLAAVCCNYDLLQDGEGPFGMKAADFTHVGGL
ncbi:MAG: hypothetical protein HY291_24390 [Planctomycetes bacterium]|nr:hypothetical protein [Planctomycetota bacterium]